MSKSNVTPAGIAVWPRLNSPDTKFDEDGVYKVDLVLGAEESEELRESLTQIAKENYQAELKKTTDGKKKAALKKFELQLPFTEEVDEDGEETGNFVFKFKTKAKDKKGNAKKLPLVDAKKKPLGEFVGSGSTIKVAFFPKGYIMTGTKKYGTTLYLNAVQVLDLVASGAGGANAFDEEDGFESEEDPTENTGDSTEGTEDPGDDADF